MEYELADMRTFNIQYYLNENPDTYFIFTTGSCNCELRKGSFRTALIYNKNAMVYEANVNDTSSTNYCMLQGIKQTMGRILYKNTKICVITGTPLGFNRAKKEKGANLHVIKEILENVNQNGNDLKIVKIKYGSGCIKSWINQLQKCVDTKNLNG